MILLMIMAAIAAADNNDTVNIQKRDLSKGQLAGVIIGGLAATVLGAVCLGIAMNLEGR